MAKGLRSGRIRPHASPPPSSLASGTFGWVWASARLYPRARKTARRRDSSPRSRRGPRVCPNRDTSRSSDRMERTLQNIPGPNRDPFLVRTCGRSGGRTPNGTGLGTPLNKRMVRRHPCAPPNMWPGACRVRDTRAGTIKGERPRKRSGAQRGVRNGSGRGAEKGGRAGRGDTSGRLTKGEGSQARPHAPAPFSSPLRGNARGHAGEATCLLAQRRPAGDRAGAPEPSV